MAVFVVSCSTESWEVLICPVLESFIYETILSSFYIWTPWSMVKLLVSTSKTVKGGEGRKVVS